MSIIDIFANVKTVYIIAQIIGFAGMGLMIVSYQQHTRKNLIVLQILASTLFTLHFFLLGAYTGAALNAVEIFRNIIFVFTGSVKKYRNGFAVLFSAIFIVSGIFTWQGPISLLPIIAMLLSTFALTLDKPSAIRKMSVAPVLLWLVYNFLTRSYAGVITEILDVISLVTAFFRLDYKRRK